MWGTYARHFVIWRLIENEDIYNTQKNIATFLLDTTTGYNNLSLERARARTPQSTDIICMWVIEIMGNGDYTIL